ncbi:hypothetical protein G6F68_016140 [Rhizopus microsporus]|nr:hypothetical protein G6F68_016140 [Rhizopus microsporus]
MGGAAAAHPHAGRVPRAIGRAAGSPRPRCRRAPASTAGLVPRGRGKRYRGVAGLRRAAEGLQPGGRVRAGLGLLLAALLPGAALAQVTDTASYLRRMDSDGDGKQWRWRAERG